MLVYANILQPLIDLFDNLLTWLHDDVGLGWGLSIVVLTVLVRLAILPLTIKQVKSMNALRALQPEVKEIQEKYKNDRQRMNQEMMAFYKENNLSPFASCLPLLLQLPVFLALYQLLNGSSFKEQVQATGNNGFLIIDDITKSAHGLDLIILIVLFITSQMASTLVMTATADKNQQRIFLLLPLVFAALIPNFPAGLIVYWITTNFWTLGQQLVVRRISPPPVPVAAGAPARALVGEKNGKRGASSDGGGGDGGGGTATKAPAKAPPRPPRKKKRRRR
jgi:YidC/Oxa1 family membrane protein insertase